MAVTAVSSSSIIGDIVTKIATFLQSSLTDPRSSRTDSTWVYPSFPDVDVEYPIVSVTHAGSSDSWTSIGTVYKEVIVTVQVDVFSKSTKERDQVWDEIYDDLRDNFISTIAGGYNLVDMVLLSCFNMDELAPKGAGNIHRKVARINFTFYATS